MDDLVNQFLEYLKLERQRSQNTLSAYKKDLAQFVAVLRQSESSNNQDLIPKKPVELYLQWLKDQDYLPSTIARKCAAVRGFLDFYAKDDLLSLTYIDNFQRNLPPIRHAPQVLTKTEIQALLDAPMTSSSPLALRDTAILSLMYETGIRAADVVDLMIYDFDSAGSRIYVRTVRQSFFPLRETSSKLDKYLSDGRPHLSRIPEEQHLFLNQRGKGLTRQGIWFVVKSWAGQANLERQVSPNTIRHSLIQHLLDSGLTNREVLKRLGLKSPNSLRPFAYSRRKQGEE